METNERDNLIERIKDDMRKQREIRKALISVINTYKCDMSEYQSFSTHTECYNELQMVEMIAAKFAALIAAAGSTREVVIYPPADESEVHDDNT